MGNPFRKRKCGEDKKKGLHGPDAFEEQCEVSTVRTRLKSSARCCVKLVRPSFWLSAVFLTDLLLP